MDCYTKPNANLPISLHDAQVTALKFLSASPNKPDGIIIFIFENGFKNIIKTDVCQTGRATVKFSGVDFDFSHVNYYKENHKQKKSFEELAEDIKIQSFNIYGRNLWIQFDKTHRKYDFIE